MLYGQEDNENAIRPSFYENSTGITNVKVYYNGIYDCYDYYELELGETPTINISLYNLDTGTWITGIVLVNQTYSTLDINNEGYYYSYFTADYKLKVHTEFRIVFKVGNGYNVPQEQIHYDYDNVWLDQLESYDIIIDGISTTSEINYDLQGNPIEITNFKYEDARYHHAILSWDGRKLINITVYDSSLEVIAQIDYTYNDQGIRIKKSITDECGTTVYEYKLSGSTVLAEIVTDAYNSTTHERDYDYIIMYNYDYGGAPIGFSIYTTTNTFDYIYIYMKNQMGDITHIITTSGTLVAEYNYDAYGNVDISGTLGSTVGTYNSIRYRSYIYDDEIGMYYLNSRYYNPKISRFINADGLLGKIGDISSANMYAYCANNPVMYLDPSGNVALVDDFVFGFAAYMLLTIAVIVVSYIAVETGMLNDFGNFLYESKNKIDNAITEMFMSLSISIAGLYNNVLASSKKSAKERSTQHPSYVNRGMIDKTLDAHQNATNMMNNKWGKGNWGKGPGSDYNQIVKWIVRGELLKEILIRVYNNEADEKEYYLIYDYFGVWNYENL